jgi:hypothetical protein
MVLRDPRGVVAVGFKLLRRERNEKRKAAWGTLFERDWAYRS